MANAHSISTIAISLILLLFCFSNGWNYSYKEKYKIIVNDEYDGNSKDIGKNRQPSAILFDIDGDGDKELIFVTTSLFLRVYHFRRSSSSIYATPNQDSYKEVSLLSNAQLRSSIVVIAMKASRIHMNSEELGIITILSNNGIISCYDQSLNLFWKVSIYESSLINMSHLCISDSAIYISTKSNQQPFDTVYVVISYVLGRKHLVKALSERLTKDEIAVLKEHQIVIGNDVNLEIYQNSNHFYILEKYKSIFDRLVSINEIKILQLHAVTGDIIWRKSISPNTRDDILIPQSQSILNRSDREQRVVDDSDYSESITLFFPHHYQESHDSRVSIQRYTRNMYSKRENYMDSPLRSLLPLDIISRIISNVHKHHTPLQSGSQKRQQEHRNNVVIIHSYIGILALDCQTGRLIFVIPLQSNQLHTTISYHMGDIVSFFLTPQPFTGDNDVLGSYSRCYLQAVSMKTVLFTTNICGSGKRRVSDDDEILILPPIQLPSLNGYTESIVTLTSEGVITCTAVNGMIEWSKVIAIRWSEFDEKSGYLPSLTLIHGMICVSDSKSVLYLSRHGKIISRVSIPEALSHAVHSGNEEDGDEQLVLQTTHSITIYEVTAITYMQGFIVVLLIMGILFLFYSLIVQRKIKIKER